MNRKQLFVLSVGIVALVLTGLFAPWIPEPGTFIGWTYSFITVPPEGSPGIDVIMLSIQWALLALITGGLIAALTGKKRTPPATDRRERP